MHSGKKVFKKGYSNKGRLFPYSLKGYDTHWIPSFKREKVRTILCPALLIIIFVVSHLKTSYLLYLFFSYKQVSCVVSLPVSFLCSIPYPLSLIPYPLSLIPYPLSLIPYPFKGGIHTVVSFLGSIPYPLFLIPYPFP